MPGLDFQAGPWERPGSTKVRTSRTYLRSCCRLERAGFLGAVSIADIKTFTDEIAGPRGRLRLDRMVKEATQLRGTAICDFDELTHDVLHNQILKATLTNLAGCTDVENETRHELAIVGATVS